MRLTLIDTRGNGPAGAQSSITDEALLRLAGTLPTLDFIRAPDGRIVRRGVIEPPRAVLFH